MGLNYTSTLICLICFSSDINDVKSLDWMRHVTFFIPVLTVCKELLTIQSVMNVISLLYIFTIRVHENTEHKRYALSSLYKKTIILGALFLKSLYRYTKHSGFQWKDC